VQITNTLDSVTVPAGGTSYTDLRDAVTGAANANRPVAVTNNILADPDETEFGTAASITVDLTTLNPGGANGDRFVLNGQAFVLTNDPAVQTGGRNSDGAIMLFADDFSALTDREGRNIARAIEDATGLRTTWNVDTNDVANSHGISGDGTGGLQIWAAPSEGGGVVQGGELVFQIGANGGADQRVSLSVNAMDTTNLGESAATSGFERVSGRTLASASILTQDQANAAIDIIDGALDMVSAQRAQLGAMQNRLESTMNSLGIARENLTAAESTIRDVDMAAEMMQFTQNNILTQAAQAMLAQANQLPQGVLQLLR